MRQEGLLLLLLVLVLRVAAVTSVYSAQENVLPCRLAFSFTAPAASAPLFQWRGSTCLLCSNNGSQATRWLSLYELEGSRWRLLDSPEGLPAWDGRSGQQPFTLGRGSLAVDALGDLYMLAQVLQPRYRQEVWTLLDSWNATSRFTWQLHSRPANHTEALRDPVVLAGPAEGLLVQATALERQRGVNDVLNVATLQLYHLGNRSFSTLWRASSPEMPSSSAAAACLPPLLLSLLLLLQLE